MKRKQSVINHIGFVTGPQNLSIIFSLKLLFMSPSVKFNSWWPCMTEIVYNRKDWAKFTEHMKFEIKRNLLLSKATRSPLNTLFTITRGASISRNSKGSRYSQIWCGLPSQLTALINTLTPSSTRLNMWNDASKPTAPTPGINWPVWLSQDLKIELFSRHHE